MVPPPLALMAGPRRGDAVDDPVEVDGHGAPVGLGVEVVTHAAPRGDPGVEVRDVQAAEGLDRERRRRLVLAAGSATSVRMKWPPSSSATARARGRRRCRRSRHARPSAGQVPGHPLADAVAAPGDESDLAVHVECHGEDRRGPGAAQPTSGAGRGGRARRSGAGSGGSWPRRAAAGPGGPRRRWPPARPPRRHRIRDPWRPAPGRW